MTLVSGDYLWCRRSVQYFLACYEKKMEKSTDTLAAPATLTPDGDTFQLFHTGQITIIMDPVD